MQNPLHTIILWTHWDTEPSLNLFSGKCALFSQQWTLGCPWLNLTSHCYHFTFLFHFIFVFFHFLVKHPSRRNRKTVALLKNLCVRSQGCALVTIFSGYEYFSLFMWPSGVINMKVNWLWHLCSSYLSSVFIRLCNCMYRRNTNVLYKYLLSFLFTQT